MPRLRENPQVKKFFRDIGKNIGRYARQQVRSGAVTRTLARYGGQYAGDQGSQTGRALGRAITGHGDYHVMGRGFKKRRYTRRREGGYMGHRRSGVKLEKGEMVITHSEYLGELISGNQTSSSFVAYEYGINPGNSQLFPWLSGVANSFQEWSMDKLIFEYKSLSAESAGASTVVPMGSVIIATQYDSMVAPFANKQQMENSDFSVSAKPSKSLLHAIECKKSLNVLGNYYVSSNTSATASNQTNNDIRFQNMGYIQVASQGIPTGGNSLDLGELWVHYTVRLLKPTIVGTQDGILTAHYQCTAVSSANQFGTSQIVAANGTIPITFPTTSSFALPASIENGSFLCVYYVTGLTDPSGGVVPATAAPTVSQGSVVVLWNNASASPDALGYSVAPSQSDTATNTYMYAFVLSVNAPGATACLVTMPSVTYTGGAHADLLITAWNPLVIT